MTLQRSAKKFQGRVLIVDDNWLTLKLIEKMLNSFDLSTEVVDSGEKALQRLNEASFDILFLDCVMPEIDGYTVAKKIRSEEKNGMVKNAKNLRIIAFTADDSKENRQHCREAGMDGLFPKPYSYNSLEELLTQILKPAAP